MVEMEAPGLTVSRQCRLLTIPRSTLYHKPQGESPGNLHIMKKIDELYTSRPFYGSRRVAVTLGAEGVPINRKRIQRLMRIMGLAEPSPRKDYIIFYKMSHLGKSAMAAEVSISWILSRRDFRLRG